VAGYNAASGHGTRVSTGHAHVAQARQLLLHQVVYIERDDRCQIGQLLSLVFGAGSSLDGHAEEVRPFAVHLRGRLLLMRNDKVFARKHALGLVAREVGLALSFANSVESLHLVILAHCG